MKHFDDRVNGESTILFPEAAETSLANDNLLKMNSIFADESAEHGNYLQNYTLAYRVHLHMHWA